MNSKKVMKLIKNNDVLIRKREDVLMSEINEVYIQACKKALNKFKVLKDSKETSVTKEISKVLDKTMEAFSNEFNKLVKPVTLSTQESYEEGLREAGQLIELI